MSIDTESDRATRHAREIQDIIDEHAALAVNKEGRELIEVREKCSRLIGQACRRHVTENNTQPARPDDSDANGDLTRKPAGAPDPTRTKTAG